MKTFKLTTLSWGCVLAMLVTTTAQPTDTTTSKGPATATNAAPAASRDPAAPAQAPAPNSIMGGTASSPSELAPPKDQPPAMNSTQAEGAKPAENTSAPSAPTRVVAEGEKGLRLNFRGAPLELVLDYLSEAAGFIIRPEVDVKGKINVWSNQPLTKDEAVELLNSALNKNGYAALRDGRTLTIVTRDEAKRRGGTPVKSGNDPAAIPKDDEIVTQIIPVRFINAVQLTKDLQPLLPAQATLTANEGGNAMVITDTQINIRRMAEIIKALDTSVASISTVRVFPLRYADAKSLANIIKEVFQTPGTSANNLQARFLQRFRGGPGGQGDGNAASTGSEGRPGASRVAAVADERGNALVVSAPDDLLPIIEELVKSVDVNVEDVTEVRVFHLKYSDPQEMADLLFNLFPDQSSTQDSRRRQRANTATDQSERMKKQGKVVAVADARTGSVVVSAAKDLMDQIAKMVDDLDSDPAKKQKVFVFDVQNTDPQQVQNILQGLFPGQNYGSAGNTRTTTRQSGPGNQLNTRGTQTQNQNVNRNTGFGTGAGIGTTGR